LRGYDYSLPGGYFITICTKHRIDIFGEVRDGEMIRNEYGNIVQSCWDKLRLHYPTIQSDEFAIMPNHIHGIIEITENTVWAIHKLPLNFTTTTCHSLRSCNNVVWNPFYTYTIPDGIAG